MSRWKGISEKACHVRLQIIVSDTNGVVHANTHAHSHTCMHTLLQIKWTWGLSRRPMMMMKVVKSITYNSLTLLTLSLDRRQRAPSNALDLKSSVAKNKNDAMREQRTQSAVSSRPPAVVQRRTMPSSLSDGG